MPGDKPRWLSGQAGVPMVHEGARTWRTKCSIPSLAMDVMQVGRHELGKVIGR